MIKLTLHCFTRLSFQSLQNQYLSSPAFASSKKSLYAGLRAYEKLAQLASVLVKKDGFLGLCSCSHAADIAKFKTVSVRGIRRAGRTATLIHTGFASADHPQHALLSESGYLKSLFFRL